MHRLLIAGMLVAAAVLTAEIIGAVAGLDRDEVTVAVAEPREVIAGTATGAVKPEVADELAGRILARPLFSSTRRPAAQSRRADVPRLCGLVSWPGGGYAIFQPEASAHPVVVREGARLGQWTVRDITADTVIISHDEERLILHTSFADASPDAKSTAQPDKNPRISVVPKGNHYWTGGAGNGGTGFPEVTKLQ